MCLRTRQHDDKTEALLKKKKNTKTNKKQTASRYLQSIRAPEQVAFHEHLDKDKNNV